MDVSESNSESMGYNDKQKALKTLHLLDGRDIIYQYRAIKNYHTSAKKILKITKQEEKIKNIGEAIEVFDEWLRDYKEKNRGKTNLSYLPIETIKAFIPLAEHYGIVDTDFYEAYKKTNGNYKAMRDVKILDETTTWDVERNKRLREMINAIESKDLEWYETDDDIGKGYPSKEHVRCILLAYSPDPSKLKALLPKISQTFQSSDRVDKMNVNEENERRTKRSRVSSSSSSGTSENEEPAKKTVKKQSEQEKQENGSGLSFKDKKRALKSIKSLEGRDVSYQYHALSGLVKRATRVISCTKDEEKIKNMKAAVEIFENWITDYNVNHRVRENFGYLTLNIIEAYIPLAVKYGLEIPEFVRAYEKVGGDYKKLRAVKIPDKDITWDIQRNRHLRTTVENIKDKNKLWFETDGTLRGLPTREHTECIMWGFSHEPAKLKKTLTLLNEKLKI